MAGQPGPGRPGRGRIDLDSWHQLAVEVAGNRWIDQRPEGVTLAERTRQAVKILGGADPTEVMAAERTTLTSVAEHRRFETLRRSYRRWRNEQAAERETP